MGDVVLRRRRFSMTDLASARTRVLSAKRAMRESSLVTLMTVSPSLTAFATAGWCSLRVHVGLPAFTTASPWRASTPSPGIERFSEVTAALTPMDFNSLLTAVDTG